MSTAFPAMMADVMDYDKLRMGFDRSGAFVAIDKTIEGMFGVVGEPIPQFTIAAFGYRNNGGCACGCGVRCSVPYLRWSCPYDIGYACTRSLAHNPLFYGDPFRRPPCTLQPDAVIASIRMFYFTIPICFYVVAAVLALRAPITDEVRYEITEGIRAREVNGCAYDPIQGEDLQRVAEGEPAMVEMTMLQFAEHERKLLAEDPREASSVAKSAAVNIVCYASAMTGIICFFSFVDINGVLSKLSTMLLTLVPLTFMTLIAWEAMKLLAINQARRFICMYSYAISANEESRSAWSPAITSTTKASLMRWKKKSKSTAAAEPVACRSKTLKTQN